jgi:D-threo-aldose 1-dehydrogenase
LKVPRIGLGTAHIGKYGQEEAVAIVQKSLEMGINFIDTAPLYQTETYIGIALEGVDRNSYVLASKVGQLPGPNNTRINIYTRDAILSHIEDSLKRLKLDRIDILHIHDADKHYRPALDEAYPTLAELRNQGVIKAVGAGMNQWEMLLDFAKNADFDCFLLAGRYTLLEQTSLDALQYFQDHQIGVFAGGVYNSGILATGATSNAQYNYDTAPPEIMARARKLESLCQKHNVPLNAAAVQFVWTHPAFTSLVIGADRVEQVEENLNTLDVPIPQAFWAELRESGLVAPGSPLPGSA